MVVVLYPGFLELLLYILEETKAKRNISAVSGFQLGWTSMCRQAPGRQWKAGPLFHGQDKKPIIPSQSQVQQWTGSSSPPHCSRLYHQGWGVIPPQLKHTFWSNCLGSLEFTYSVMDHANFHNSEWFVFWCCVIKRKTSVHHNFFD